MARFDVYANPDKQEGRLIPFYLDVQSDYVKGLQTRVVVPLWKSELFTECSENLNPKFEIAGQGVVMDTPAMGAVPANAFQKPIASLISEQLTVQDALDTLFVSY